MRMYTAFDSWPDLLNYIRSGARVYYQAPLDWQPTGVQCKAFKNGKVRVIPPIANADPFTADVAHLSRFRAPVEVA